MYPAVAAGRLCALFGKTRQAWYVALGARQEQELAEAIVLKLVGEVRQDLPRAGVPQLMEKLRTPLRDHRIKMGRDALYELLGRHGYLLRYRRRRPYTTDSNHAYKKYPNLIRNVILTYPGQLWVSDITYLRLMQGFCYLSIVTDAYSRKIVGYQLHQTLHSEGALGALQMALKTARRARTLTHHSDRGVQYCCAAYVQELERQGIAISMTEQGDPYENAIAERINGILKGEFLLGRTFGSFAEAQEAVRWAVDKYNHVRPHSSCGYLTPAAAHETSGPLRNHWRRKTRLEGSTASEPAGGLRSTGNGLAASSDRVEENPGQSISGAAL